MTELQKPERNEKDQDYGRASEVAKDGPTSRVAERLRIADQIRSMLMRADMPGGTEGSALEMLATELNGLERGLRANPVTATREQTAEGNANHDTGPQANNPETPELSKCEDCGGSRILHSLNGIDWVHCPFCTGKANPSPPTQPDQPTGTIFDLDIFREKLERRANSVEGSTTTNVFEPYGEVQTGDRMAEELRGIAAELKTLIDNCMKQYVHTAQPVPIQGEGPYRFGDSIYIGEHGRLDGTTPLIGYREPAIANAAWKEGHQAGASSRDQVVEAAAVQKIVAYMFEEAGRARSDGYPNIAHAYETAASMLENSKNLITVLNPNSETEKPNHD